MVLVGVLFAVAAVVPWMAVFRLVWLRARLADLRRLLEAREHRRRVLTEQIELLQVDLRGAARR